MAELYEKCLRVGLRMTLPRKIILEVIEAADDHPDVDESIEELLKKIDQYQLQQFTEL